MQHIPWLSFQSNQMDEWFSAVISLPMKAKTALVVWSQPLLSTRRTWAHSIICHQCITACERVSTRHHVKVLWAVRRAVKCYISAVRRSKREIQMKLELKSFDLKALWLLSHHNVVFWSSAQLLGASKRSQRLEKIEALPRFPFMCCHCLQSNNSLERKWHLHG